MTFSKGARTQYLLILGSFVISYWLVKFVVPVFEDSEELTEISQWLAFFIVYSVLLIVPVRLFSKSDSSQPDHTDLALKIYSRRVKSDSELFSNLSHDVNNSLSVIFGRASMFKLKNESGALTTQYLDAGIQKIEVAAKAITEAISGARHFAGHFEQRPAEEFFVQDLFEILKVSLSLRIKNKSIKTEFNSEANPKVKTQLHVLTELLSQLADRCIKSAANAEQKVVQIDFRQRENHIEFSVIDFDPIHSQTSEDILMWSIHKSLVEKIQGELILDSSGAESKRVVRLPASCVVITVEEKKVSAA